VQGRFTRDEGILHGLTFREQNEELSEVTQRRLVYTED
jgi:hypothetical protein